MGVLTDIFRPVETEKRGFSEVLMGLGWGSPSAAGVKVSEEGSLTYTAVWACVRVLSESLAGLPLVLYQQNGDRRERAERHPLYFILKEQPNPEMTSFEFRELLVSHVCTWGNAYAEIVTDGSGRIRALWPLRPDMMEKITRDEMGDLVYHYRRPDQQLVMLPGDRIMHWRGLGSNGLLGWSPIKLHMEAIGLGLGTQEFGARFFGNGARPGMVVKHPGRLSPEAIGRLKTSWGSDHGGLNNAHRVKILEEGMDVATIGVPPEEAQFLETRKFQVTEIARIFRVPPHMLADLERATFSNIEHQSIDFVAHTLRPWMVRIEQAIQRDLLSESERQRYFVKHLADALLRGDTMTRYQAYSTGIQTGVLTPNEARVKEDMNPIDGGDELYMPLNLAPIGLLPQTITPSPSATGTAARATAVPGGKERLLTEIEKRERRMELRQSRLRIMNRYVRLYEEAAGRLVRREVADIRRALPRYLGKRSIGEFSEWLDKFYEDLRDVVPDYFRAIMLALSDDMMAAVAEEVGGEEPRTDEEWLDTYLRNFAAVYTVGGAKQLQALLAEAQNEEEAEAAILERMDGWEDTRASKTATDQAFEAGNALALWGMAALGVVYKVWAGGDCPLCQQLNGVVVEIDKPFLNEGDTLDPEDGQTAPFTTVRYIGHPPLHRGCDCVILAG